MPCQVYFKISEVEQGRTHIFLKFILLLSFIFYRTDQWAAIGSWNVERFHDRLQIYTYFVFMNIHFEPVRWSLNTNLYEVNVRQYTREGTFRAFMNELPRLRDMGVQVLWFMPITPISLEKRLGTLGSYYACSDYTDTNTEFGTV